MVDICVAFLRLFRKYVEEADKRSVRRLNELVLQIIPSDFITGDDSLVIPTQNDYLRLALEVYSRCPPQDPISDAFAGAPAFTLATSVPKMIPFRLTTEEGSPMDAGQACHVAYSVSQDQRWVTAAWCDNLGLRQLTLSYSLRRDVSHTCRPLSEVREDIWQVMVDMTGMSRCRWRVVLAKDEPMDTEEITGTNPALALRLLSMKRPKALTAWYSLDKSCGSPQPTSLRSGGSYPTHRQYRTKPTLETTPSPTSIEYPLPIWQCVNSGFYSKAQHIFS